MTVFQLLAIAAFIVVVVIVVVVVRRMGHLVAGSREADEFRDAVADLARRSLESLDAVAARIDAVRRRTLDPASIADEVTGARSALRGYAEEAGRLRGPDGSQVIRDALAGELSRAERALDAVEHGSSLLAAAGDEWRATEAQTSLKRGYLNLLHVREAVVREATAAATLAAGARRRPRM